MSRSYGNHFRRLAGQKFEDQVRRLVRDFFDVSFQEQSLLPVTVGTGEVDILYTDEIKSELFYIEATLSRELTYIEKKLESISGRYIELKKKYPGWKKNIWFILNEPQNHQVDSINQFNTSISNPFEIVLYSFDQLQQLVEKKDAKSFENWYLNERVKYPFGSARNPRATPDSDNIDINKIEYLPCNIYMDENKISIDSIIENLELNNLSFITGEYGLGKSLTLANIFFKIRDKYLSGDSEYFPIFIDLKQRNYIQHFVDIYDLVNSHLTAMNNTEYAFSMIKNIIESDKCILIFDGIDEIALMNIDYSIKDRMLLNSENLKFIKDYILRRKGKQGLIFSVRSNFFFDFETEMKQYFLINESDFIHYELLEFSYEEAKDLYSLFNKEIPTDLPDLKPLLLSKLAINNVFNSSDSAEAFCQVLDYIISREYSGHFAAAKEIRQEQFVILLHEIASYSMTQKTYDYQIQDQILIDIYNRVVKRSPSFTMERELKKLMIFRFNDDETVSLYDEHIVDSICLRLIMNIGETFNKQLENPGKKSYGSIVESSISNCNYNIDILRKWDRMLPRRTEELFELLYTQNWNSLTFKSYLFGLCTNELDQLAFIILSSFYIISSDSDLEFNNLRNITNFDTSHFTKFEQYHIRVNNSIIEDINIHSTKSCFIFTNCLVLNISFKDEKLLYREDLKKYHIDHIFNSECEIALINEPVNVSKKKKIKSCSYRNNKEKAIFWCLNKIQSEKSYNRRYFYSNYQSEKISKKDLDWALRKLVSFGYLSIFSERGNSMFKKLKTQEITNAIKNDMLPPEFDKYFRER